MMGVTTSTRRISPTSTHRSDARSRPVTALCSSSPAQAAARRGSSPIASRMSSPPAGIDEKRYPRAQVGHAISTAKNELMDASAYAASPDGSGHLGAVVARAFAVYERELRAADALDFDDLLLRSVDLLRDAPPVREHYQERFRHIFVDEYQDTNRG